VGYKWVFVHKRNGNNEVARYKARLVAQSFTTTRNYLICDAFSAMFSENVTNVHCSPKHCDDFFNSSRFYDVFLFFVTDLHRSPKHYDDLLNSSRFYDVFLFSSQTLRRLV
jgi:hypothetical protein